MLLGKRTPFECAVGALGGAVTQQSATHTRASNGLMIAVRVGFLRRDDCCDLHLCGRGNGCGSTFDCGSCFAFGFGSAFGTGCGSGSDSDCGCVDGPKLSEAYLLRLSRANCFSGRFSAVAPAS